MSYTTDPDEARNSGTRFDGQQNVYCVLSDEERAKGFVRPVRDAYRHVGVRPKYEMRALTPEEAIRFSDVGYVAFEEYPESEAPHTGRYWTADQLNSGCGQVTTMGQPLAETYARNPGFYGGTFCAACRTHFPVGPHGEFEWLDGTKVGA